MTRPAISAIGSWQLLRPMYMQGPEPQTELTDTYLKGMLSILGLWLRLDRGWQVMAC